MLSTLHDIQTRCYSELVLLDTFEERFDYLKLVGATVGVDTFGYHRFLNQTLYQSKLWKDIRNRIILRDNACDLGIPGYELYGNIRIHHINPITKNMINERHPFVFEEEYLITTSFDTHNAIHYGSLNGENIASRRTFIERKPNDTTPWR